jgi:hypothetical protein
MQLMHVKTTTITHAPKIGLKSVEREATLDNALAAFTVLA